MNDELLLVKDLGEHGLLKKLQGFCPRDVIGDDGAILATDPHKSLVVTTDVLVEDVHFSDRTTRAYDAGWRGAAANLSDLAAMGATPLGITVGLSLPGDKSVAWVEDLYRGLDACLKTHQTPIVGGDVSRSKVTSIAITAFGEVNPQRAILRSQARPGDAIIATGLHGLSRGGLEILLNPSKGKTLNSQARDKLLKAHQRPNPRLDILKYLAQIPDHIAIAGMDSSDGLADAVQQICHSSNCGATINKEKLTLFSGLIDLAGPETAWEWLLYGGEDFELVLSLPMGYAVSLVDSLVKNLGSDAAIIGRITNTKGVQIINKNTNSQLQLDTAKGFQHF